MRHPATSPSFLRGFLFVLLFFIPPAVIGASALAWSPLLPEEIATHWSNGVADGYTPLWQLFVGCMAVALLSGAAAVLTVADSRDVRDAALPISIAGGFCGLSCSAWLTLAGTNLAPGSSLDTRSGGLSILGLAYGLVVRLALGHPRHAAPKPPAGHEDMRDDRSLSWHEDVSSALLAALGLSLPVIAGALLWGAWAAGGWPPSAPVILLVVALASTLTISLSRVRVTVDHQGFRVRSLISRLPVMRVRLSDIAAAEASRLTASTWGGWGYRVLPGRRALIITTGLGLIVTTKSGRTLAVSAPSSEMGAAVLTNLLRHETNRPPLASGD